MLTCTCMAQISCSLTSAPYWPRICSYRGLAVIVAVSGGSAMGTVPDATTPSPHRSAAPIAARRSAARSSARSPRRACGRLLASTIVWWSSALNLPAGSCSRTRPPCAVSRRELRPTVWNSSSTPTVTAGESPILTGPSTGAAA